MALEDTTLLRKTRKSPRCSSAVRCFRIKAGKPGQMKECQHPKGFRGTFFQKLTSNIFFLCVGAFLLLVVLVTSRRQKVNCCLRQQVLQLTTQQVQQRLHHFGTQFVCIGPGNPQRDAREAIVLKQETLQSLYSSPHPVLMARICSRRVDATLRAVLS